MENKQILDSLGNVLASPVFSRTQRQARLLRYIVEKTLAGDRDGLKEFTLAQEVFDRDATYDPQTDSTVRVEVSKLRTRLTGYYERFGENDAVRIDIPKGGYVAEFREWKPAPVEQQATGSRRHWLWAAAAGVAGLAAWRLGNWGQRAKVAAVLQAGEPAERGGASKEALEALAELTGGLNWNSKQQEARLLVTLRVGRQWGNGTGVHVVGAVTDLDRASSPYSGVWQSGGEALTGIRAAVERLSAAERVSKERTSALRAYRQALGIIGEGKSFVVQTAKEKAERAPLQGLLEAAALLDEALREDPSLAEARAKLAWVYHLAAEYDSSLRAKVGETATAAIASGGPPEAHYVLGYQNLFADWDPARAQTNFAACLDRAAFHKDAARLHTDSACINGAVDLAARRLEPLLSVEPRAAALRAAAFLLAERTGEFAEMERLARETLRWDPGAALPRWQLGQALRAQGRDREAEEQYRFGLARDPGSKKLMFALARLRAGQRRGDEARRLAGEAGLAGSNPSLMALLELEQGSVDRAIGWIEKAIAQREVSLCYLALDPGIRRMREDARLAALLAQLRLSV